MSTVAAGGASWAAIITTSANRAEARRTRAFEKGEADRTRAFQEGEAARTRAWTELQADKERAAAQQDWERDRVTEHYLALVRAAWDVHRTYSEVVIPCYTASPVGDTDVAWAAIDAAYGKFLAEATTSQIVARGSMLRAMEQLGNVGIEPLVPAPNRRGVAPVLLERATAEGTAWVQFYLSLVNAARADLGLKSPATAETPVPAVSPAAQRSLAEGRTEEQLRDVLSRCGVGPVVGARSDLLIDGTGLSAFQMELPALRGDLRALLIYDEREMVAAVRDDLNDDQRYAAPQPQPPTTAPPSVPSPELQIEPGPQTVQPPLEGP